MLQNPPSRSDFRSGKICHCFCFSPSCHEMIGPDAILVLNASLSQLFASFTLIMRLFSSFLLPAITVVCIIRISEIVESILIPTCNSFSLALEAWCTLYVNCMKHNIFAINNHYFWYLVLKHIVFQIYIIMDSTRHYMQISKYLAKYSYNK